MKSKKGLIASIVIAIIVILALAGGLIYAKTDLFKPANKLFYKYLLGEKTEFDYDEFLEQVKNAEGKEYSSNGEINANIDMQSTSAYARSNLSNINKFKVEFEQKNKPKENKMSSNIKLSYDNKEVVKANLLKSSDIYGIQSDIMNDKYIVVENNNLKELAKKLGIDDESIPNKFEQVATYDLLYVSKEDRKEIVNNYKQVINDKIGKEKYTTEKNIETEVNGEKIKTKTYKLTITEKEMYEVIKSILETAKDDEKTQELIISKYEMINKNVQDGKELTKDKIKDYIEDFISDIDRELKYTTEDTMDIIVYVNKGKTVKIEAKDNDNTVSAEFFKKENKNNIVLSIKDKHDDYKFNIEYEVRNEENAKSLIGTITILSDDKEQAKINYDIETKGMIGKGKNEIIAKFNLESDGDKIELNIKENVNYDEKVTIEDLDSNKIAKLNDMSEDEIKDLFMDIYQKVQNDLPKILEETGISELFESNYDKYDLDDNTNTNDDNNNDYDSDIETLDEE